MRKMLLVGLVLTVASVLVVLVSPTLDLELEPVVLLGVSVGAAIALVPDHTPMGRLAGFLGGFVAAWIGFLLRAAVLPDSTGGRAVAVALVVVLVVGLSAATLGRAPLWSALLGAGAFAGAYEFTYSAAPPEFASTSLSSATALLLTVAVGFLAASLVAPEGEPALPRGTAWPKRRKYDDATDRLADLMMEDNK